MTTEFTPTDQGNQKTKVMCQGGASGAVYGMGLIGAWIYFVGHAATFWLGVLGIFKGIFWPAVLVYEVLKYLNL